MAKSLNIIFFQTDDFLTSLNFKSGSKFNIKNRIYGTPWWFDDYLDGNVSETFDVQDPLFVLDAITDKNFCFDNAPKNEAEKQIQQLYSQLKKILYPAMKRRFEKHNSSKSTRKRTKSVAKS